MNKGRQDYSKTREGKITGAGPREESLQVSNWGDGKGDYARTQWPEARITGDKIATGKGYFKCTHIFQRADQVTEIMNLILAISHFSRLGSPLVVQPRPLVGGSVSTRGHEEWEDIWNLQFLFPLLISRSEGREKGLPWTVSDWKHPWHSRLLRGRKKRLFFFFADLKVIL